MGPHVFACGNALPRPSAVAARTLQWGRTFLRAEMHLGEPYNFVGMLLQWGRTFLRAEISPMADTCVGSAPLQWGRTFLRAEMGPTGPAGESGPPLHWGRTFLRAEITTIPVLRCSRRLSFNGAARFCVRKFDDLGEVVLQDVASMGPHVFACGNRTANQ